ncbi:MAG TPA: sigma-54 dependent transcriptional regulator [Desulfohalobiaceae bacterium]|nr:sigma-54 dependent transcriptional regulator [Desulfohalobiaceae bacterium]
MDYSKILVIDDEPCIGRGCHLVLTEQDFLVKTCLTGQEGLKLLNQEDFDLLLLDMKLPDIDGMEILNSIHRDQPDIYVVVITGYSTVQNAVEAMKIGAYDYLSKPFSDEELSLTIMRALEKKKMSEENRTLRKQLLDRFSFSNIVGENQDLVNIFRKIEKVAQTETTVLLYGESGTGKELFAGAIHAHSQRAARQFITLDCSTLSPTLLESELFGHIRGAFTGAVKDKTGVFQIAQDGTLFIDEVSNLTLEIQGKLLRVLESFEYKPVGACSSKKTNTRIIAATNKDLAGLVKEGKFREDLYYRLNVFPVFIPPLRERKDDIPRLAYHFLRRYCRKTGKKIQGFSDDALEVLLNFDWPGNIRQLKNIVERLIIMSDGAELEMLDIVDHLWVKKSWEEKRIPENHQDLQELKQSILEEHYLPVQKAFLIKALKDCQGNITNAAARVGMKRPNFSSLMKRHNINQATFLPKKGQKAEKLTT